ncbi:bacteriocin-like protein [Chryseobacterium indologenes]|uniref:bacteriocin-like protein n=1 Tax=Chryseobacterium indologenes TaxID=253 RepID=UPI00076E2D3C|nr:hypothetical protein [Chryseobacterium indologenes]
MKNLRKLNRQGLKFINGGIRNPNEGEVIGGGENQIFVQCCYPAGCSVCVWGSFLSSYCVNGGTLQACFG